MTITELKNKMKNPSGVYLFYGAEEYLKHHYLDQIRDAVISDQALEAFNHVILSGADALNELPGALQLLPVMSDKRLIEIHSVKYASLKGEELEDLCALLTEAGKDECLTVVLYATLSELEPPPAKRPTALFRALLGCTQAVEFSHQSPGKLIPWIAKHFSRDGIIAGNDVCMSLIEYCTCDMSALANEIKKLIDFLHEHKRDTVTKEDIAYICCRIDEIAAFDFANAILNSDRQRAYEILRDMEAKKQKPQNILGSIAAVYADLYRVRTLNDCGIVKKEIASKLKMNEYKVSLYLRAGAGRPIDAIVCALEACREADLKIKSTLLPNFGLLSSLIGAG